MRSITIALNKKEYAALERQAKKQGVSVYAFCKSAVLEEISNRSSKSNDGISEIEELKQEMEELRVLVRSNHKSK